MNLSFDLVTNTADWFDWLCSMDKYLNTVWKYLNSNISIRVFKYNFKCGENGLSTIVHPRNWRKFSGPCDVDFDPPILKWGFQLHMRILLLILKFPLASVPDLWTRKERIDGWTDGLTAQLDFGFYTSIFCVFYLFLFFFVLSFVYVFNCSLYCVSWNCFACTFVTQLIKINQSSIPQYGANREGRVLVKSVKIW